MDIIQLTGYIAGFLIGISLVPQVIQTWRTKSTRDISLPWTLILLAGLLLYFVYGIGIGEMPIIVMNGVETALVISLIIAKLKFK